MLFDIIIYFNNFMLQNNEMSKGRKNIFYLMYPTSATLKRGQKHIKCCNLLSFELIFSKFSGMIAHGRCITKILRFTKIYSLRMRSEKNHRRLNYRPICLNSGIQNPYFLPYVYFRYKQCRYSKLDKKYMHRK